MNIWSVNFLRGFHEVASKIKRDFNLLKPLLKYYGDPAETRTLDPLIKSQLLYQLSYGVNIFDSFELTIKKPRIPGSVGAHGIEPRTLCL